MQNVPGEKTSNGIKMVRFTRDSFLYYAKSVTSSKLKQQQDPYKKRQLKQVAESCFSKDFMNLTEFEKSPILLQHLLPHSKQLQREYQRINIYLNVICF